MIGRLIVMLLAFMLGGPRGEVTAAAHSYLSILFAAMPLVFVGSATTYALQASGDTRTPFAIAAFTKVGRALGVVQ